MVFRGPWRQRAVQSSALVCGSVILLVSVNQESIGGGTSLVSVEEPPTPDPPSPSPGGFAPRECRDRSLNAILRRKVEEPIERPVNDSWRSILQQCVRPQGTIGDYIELLPPEDTSEEARELLDEFAASRYNSCAVVGSGGSLHGSGLGAQIDSHDLVIRMNHHVASEAGREDIGCKTTFHALHPPNAGNVFQRLWKDGVLMPLLLERGYYSGHWLHCLLEPGGFRDTCTCMLNRSRTSWHEYYKHVHPSSFQRHYNGKAVKPECIYEPEFPSWRARPWAWIGGKRKIDRGHPCVRAAGLKRMPSSGFRSMILSMHFCNYVHLYGMADSSDRYDKNPSSPSNETNASRRSYNSIHKKHDFGGEHRFFRFLRSKSVLFQPDAT